MGLNWIYKGKELLELPEENYQGFVYLIKNLVPEFTHFRLKGAITPNVSQVQN